MDDNFDWNQMKIKRPSIERMDNLLGWPHFVLDHGWVRTIDYMGDDAAIVQAARVSYGKGTKSVSQDEGLIRYLMRHWHSTPFEMCLAGDTRIQTFPCEGAKVKHYTMRELSEAFAQGGRENSWAKLLKIRTVNPSTGVVTATKIKHAWQTGTEKVYRIVTEQPFGRSITLTNNHPILTPKGFRSIEDGLSVGDEIMHNGVPALAEDVLAEIGYRRSQGQTIKTVAEALGISPSTVYKYSPKRVDRKTGFLKKPVGEHADPRAIARRTIDIKKCQVSRCHEDARDRHHIDENPHNNVSSNLIGLCPKHHRHIHTRSRLEKAVPAKIVSITCVGVQPVYDLEVEDPNHTFVAEGIVVHNCELKLHVKLPIFVARQWIRHRTANVNEMSARYSILDNEFYIPAPHDLAAQSQVNNQGRGTVLTGNEAHTVLDMLRDEAARSYSTYEELMREDPEAGKLGLARELARMNLPTNIYTQWYWKVDLHNLFHFLRLRADAHAQFEIRAYAEVICDIVKSWVPLAYRAFEDYRMNAVTLSSMEIEALREYFAACQPDREHDGWPEPKGLSERESGEFFRKLGLMK